MRPPVRANRRTTRRSVQIVVGVSVGTALLLAVANRAYVASYGTFTGQLVWRSWWGCSRRSCGFGAWPGTRRAALPLLGESDKPGLPAEVPETVARCRGRRRQRRRHRDRHTGGRR